MLKIVFTCIVIMFCQMTGVAQHYSENDEDTTTIHFHASEVGFDSLNNHAINLNDEIDVEEDTENELADYVAEAVMLGSLNEADSPDIALDAQPEYWKSAKNDRAFNYGNPPKENLENTDNNTFFNRLMQGFYSFLNNNATIIVIVFTLLVACILIYQYVRNGNLFFQKKDKFLKKDTKDYRHLSVEDLDLQLQNAIKHNEYAKAIGLMYQLLLKIFSENEMVHLQLGKTNYQYLYELKNTSSYPIFVRLTRIFDYIHYGGREITKSQFESFQQGYFEINQQLKTK